MNIYRTCVKRCKRTFRAIWTFLKFRIHPKDLPLSYQPTNDFIGYPILDNINRYNKGRPDQYPPKP